MSPFEEASPRTKFFAASAPLSAGLGTAERSGAGTTIDLLSLAFESLFRCTTEKGAAECAAAAADDDAAAAAAGAGVFGMAGGEGRSEKGFPEPAADRAPSSSMALPSRSSSSRSSSSGSSSSGSSSSGSLSDSES
ncbi:hypothetical protein D7X99_32900 [Corallococcus sp. AB032C]|nr:hypothetical protein D7X99_32900 [Corallococcus sp. AB032C]